MKETTQSMPTFLSDSGAKRTISMQEYLAANKAIDLQTIEHHNS